MTAKRRVDPTAWVWCEQIAEKPLFNILTAFAGVTFLNASGLLLHPAKGDAT
jgi:hypothetical protein